MKLSIYRDIWLVYLDSGNIPLGYFSHTLDGILSYPAYFQFKENRNDL